MEVARATPTLAGCVHWARIRRLARVLRNQRAVGHGRDELTTYAVVNSSGRPLQLGPQPTRPVRCASWSGAAGGAGRRARRPRRPRSSPARRRFVAEIRALASPLGAMRRAVIDAGAALVAEPSLSSLG